MKILIVCLGNICRSPLAHGVLEHMSNKEGLDILVESAGTGDWHIGQQPDKRSIQVAKKYGVDISKQAGRHFNASDLDEFDRILVMDRSNLNDVLTMTTNHEQRSKVQLFLKDDIVPDPYYDDDQFEPVYQLIEERCKLIINDIKRTQA